MISIKVNSYKIFENKLFIRKNKKFINKIVKYWLKSVWGSTKWLQMN